MPEVQQMQAVLDVLKDQPGEVLFIADRQLVTFGEITRGSSMHLENLCLSA